MLSNEEIRAIQSKHPTDNDPMPFARAIIDATIAKLAQGVSVEPYCKGTTLDIPNAIPDLFTRNQLQTAIAAARVAENERLACEFDKLYTIGGDEIGPAIRALIGGST